MREATVCLCALVAGLGGLVFGYDLGVIVGALPEMVRHFKLSGFEEGLLVAGASLGGVVGALVGGPLADAYGRKGVMRSQAGFSILGSVLIATSGTLTQLLLGRLAMGAGFSLGILSNVAWVSEIVPAARRGRAVAAYELLITVGVLAALVVHAAFAWRTLFLACVPLSVVQLLCLHCVPESPVFLMGKGRRAEAEAAVEAVGGGAEHLAHCRVLAEVKVGSFWEALAEWQLPFKVMVAVQALGLLTGGVNIRVYSLRVFESVGVSDHAAHQLGIGLGVTKVVFTLLAVWKLDAFGRRVFYLAGMNVLMLGCVLVAVGGAVTGCYAQPGRCAAGPDVDCAQCPALCGECPSYASAMVVTGCFLGYAAYQLSFGPVNFAVGSDMFPPVARARFLGVQVLTQSLFQLGTTLAFPVMLEGVGLTATMLPHASFCAAGMAFVLLRMVETKQSTPQDIRARLDVVWEA